MRKILMVSGHPDLNSSTANRVIIQEVTKNLANVGVRDLGALYPDCRIDVVIEQRAMMEAEIIVWQFPLYWYSVPAVFKAYLDSTLTHGFAYGAAGNKLHGKKLIVSLTTGGTEQDYTPTGHEGMHLEAFFPPFSQTAHLCGMDYQTPIYSQGMHYIAGVSSADELADIQAKAMEHAERLVRCIQK